jgi:hypothetical protein
MYGHYWATNTLIAEKSKKLLGAKMTESLHLRAARRERAKPCSNSTSNQQLGKHAVI